MARARNIKPGFMKNEKLCEIEPLGRLLFAGLWMLADREGRLEDRPRRIWAEALPYDEYNGDELLWELHDRGFIVRYQVGDVQYICIPNFLDHQKPHQNEIDSKIPDLSNGYMTSRLGTKDLVPRSSKGTNDSGLLSDSLNPSCLNAREEPLPEKPSGTLALVKGEKREPSSEEVLADQYAPAIHQRHVNRKCSLKETRELLVKIQRRHVKDQQFAVMERIDRNHQGNCESDDWTKEGGQFCPGLDKWLNPAKERYFLEPPARAGPVIKSQTDAVAALMQKRIDEGWANP